MIEIDAKLVKSIIPTRKINANKGDFGKVLCITGSKNYTGAAMLSAVAALKTGAGYSILCSDEYTVNLLKQSCFDLIFKSHDNFNFEIVRDYIETQNIKAIVYGCGIGVNSATIEFTNKLIEYLKYKEIYTIVDADGLNCLANEVTVLNSNFIISPHPKELSKLLQTSVACIQEDRVAAVIEAQKKYNSTVILKGHGTLINNGENLYHNSTGNTALSKAGTGDVLSGMIGGFLSQNSSPVNAAISAIYLHGLAAEIYSREFSEYSMLASDLFNYVPCAIKRLLTH